jgi:hypothetical protein
MCQRILFGNEAFSGAYSNNFIYMGVFYTLAIDFLFKTVSQIGGE